METGLFDKNGTPIKPGDRTRLVLKSGEVREFDVCLKTVERTVKSHPDFDDKYAKVAITGIVFCWNGYDLFPCVDENGISDVEKMEVIRPTESYVISKIRNCRTKKELDRIKEEVINACNHGLCDFDIAQAEFCKKIAELQPGGF